MICPASGPDLFRCDDTGFGKGAGGELTYKLKLHAKTSMTFGSRWPVRTRGWPRLRPSTRRRARTRPASYRPRSLRASHWTVRPRFHCRAGARRRGHLEQAGHG